MLPQNYDQPTNFIRWEKEPAQIKTVCLLTLSKEKWFLTDHLPSKIILLVKQKTLPSKINHHRWWLMHHNQHFQQKRPHTWCLKEVQTTKNSPTVESGFFGRYWWVQSSPKISKVGHWGILNKWTFCVFLLIWCKELLSELTKQYHHDPGRVQTTLKHYPGVWHIIISHVGPLWGHLGTHWGPERAHLA